MAEILDKKNKLITDLCTVNKKIDDVLYGTIQFSKFASEVIDSIEFQRLRNMKQLGVANYVFPNAIHTRFEHSLGTYFQSKEITKRLADVTPQQEMNEYLRAIPELTDYIDKNYKEKKCDFDKYVQELVNIAALCHDLGHGPFSHLFDDIFMNVSELKNHENALHEKRSQLLIEIIIKKSPFLSARICNDHIKLIQNIIDPPKNAKGFIYQIVSNNSNSLDVDKFDYITRDMSMIGKKFSFDYKCLITQAVITNNMIAYPKECQFNIYQLFNMRHTMHRQIYNDTDVVSIQLLMSDMMNKINQLLNIVSSITDMDKFCKFTDSFIVQYPEFLDICSIDEKDDNKELKEEIINLSKRLKTNKPYHLIFAFVLEEAESFTKEDIFKDEFSQYLDDIVIYTSTVGYVSGNKSNPLDNIYLYEDIKYLNDKVQYIGNTIQKNKHGISNLISNKYQEYLTMIYFKKSDDASKKSIIPKIEEHFKNYISNYLKQYVIKYIEI
jgi:HD superfamily phosphohydrolase